MKKANCPECGREITVENYGIEDFTNHDGATLDCCYRDCQQTLLIEDGEIKDLHKAIHEKDPRWPEDGEGTGYIEY